MGRTAPSVLRFLAGHSPISRGRWPMLSALRDDPECRDWLASLENPTRTRHGFRIFTLPGDLTSDWIKLHGQHESGTERFILDNLRPGSTLVDVGANVGYFSLLAAAVGRAKAVAFEPQLPVADLLQRSVSHNRLDASVRVERVALSNARATARMTSCPGNTGHSRMARAEDKELQPYPVPVATLDEWVDEHPAGPVSACKIDTEGTELRVLQGMSRLIDREGPAITVEVADDLLADFGASGREIREFLESRGYADVSGKYGHRGDRNSYFVSRHRRPNRAAAGA
ncbi:MAG TPA: FkbM family methyltransferase [Opitutaceae bacterium]|nr:FkbM family methyltransferase [Opitutaceae bacterium]